MNKKQELINKFLNGNLEGTALLRLSEDLYRQRICLVGARYEKEKNELEQRGERYDEDSISFEERDAPGTDYLCSMKALNVKLSQLKKYSKSLCSIRIEFPYLYYSPNEKGIFKQNIYDVELPSDSGLEFPLDFGVETSSSVDLEDIPTEILYNPPQEIITYITEKSSYGGLNQSIPCLAPSLKEKKEIPEEFIGKDPLECEAFAEWIIQTMITEGNALICTVIKDELNN